MLIAGTGTQLGKGETLKPHLAITASCLCLHLLKITVMLVCMEYWSELREFFLCCW